MATNILTPMASPSYEPTMTSNANDTNPTTAETSNNDTTPSTGGLRRKSTLKAYLANKNKLKERQAMNVIVDPTVLQRSDSSGSDNELSPVNSPPTGASVMSPMSGKRIDTDLEALDEKKKLIEAQLAAITQRLNQLQSPPSSPTSAPALTTESELPEVTLPSNLTKDELVERRTRLFEELNVLNQKRRELLQSWTRDYKNLKRSGSLAKRQEDLFWVTTA
ncbi:hypothetical protein B0O80DRAFT_434126 [Mortierella sp. GBAus27b]|nr:hypothetical protein BGX31_007535 [Mortierella sp. GBA43]KAI8363619.1 hypothetical protein B0O80DRAFT_434126 [Mortierella sp. GBAus27b]